MGVYTYWKDGYAIETAWANETSDVSDDIPNASATCYKFGLVHPRAVHPSSTTSLTYYPLGVNAQEVDDGDLRKGNFDCTGQYTIGFQNGVWLWAIMGKSSTAGADPYTHTITVPSAVSGVLPKLPSFAIQHEQTGTATDWATQFIGCKVSSLTLYCGYKQPVPEMLTGVVKWIGKKPNKVAFTLTNDPALPPTGNTDKYHVMNMTRTFDGSTIAGFQDMQFTIDAGLKPHFTHDWDGGSYVGQWASDITEQPRKKYKLVMHYAPSSSALWEEAVANGNTKDIVFKWTRSTNDYIQITMTDAQILYHELASPEIGDVALEVVIEPRSVSIEVKDSIAGTYYGE